MNKKFVRLVALAAAMGGCVSSASADVSYTVGGTSDLLQFDNIDFDVNGHTTTYNNVYAGGIQISQTGTKDASLPNNYVSICTDFLGTLYVGQTYHYDGQAVQIASGQIGGIAPSWSSKYSFTLASELFNTHGDIGSGGLGTDGPTLTVEDMAALQLAVWIVLYDTTANGTVLYNNSSEFYISSYQGDSSTEIAAIKLAVQWVGALTLDYTDIDSLLEPDTTYDQNDLRGENGHDPQELMYATVPICSVPEPATILAGVLLILPLGVSTIRNLRKSQSKQG